MLTMHNAKNSDVYKNFFLKIDPVQLRMKTHKIDLQEQMQKGKPLFEHVTSSNPSLPLIFIAPHVMCPNCLSGLFVFHDW